MLGWVAVAASLYLALPISGVVPLLEVAVFGVCALWAIFGSLVALVTLVDERAYGWAVACVLAAVLSGLGIWTTDWMRIYVDSQFWLHRGEFAELASQHRAGNLRDGAELPWRLRYLSIDGRAHHRQEGILYVPAWQDWRAESGVGFGYFPTAPGPDAWITTASGDGGGPVRPLGDGWWWVE